MAVYQKITLDVNRVSKFTYIKAKQGDSGRYLDIEITVDGEVYEVPSSATVVFRAIKPDDTVQYYSGSVLSNGRVRVNLSSNTLAVSGKVFCDVSITYGNRIVSSVNFIVIVEKLPGDASAITSSSSFTALSTLVSGLNDYDATLSSLSSGKANGAGITVSMSDGILTVKEVS